MILRRGVALVASLARAVQLTGAQDLKNLETSGELKLADLLLTASDAVFDRLVVDGVDPEQLTNAEVYERAVAYQFLGLLAAQGYLGGQEIAASHFALSDRFYEQVRPRTAGPTAPRSATDAVPVVRNVSRDARRYSP